MKNVIIILLMLWITVCQFMVLCLQIKHISFHIALKRSSKKFSFKHYYVSPMIDTSNLFIVKSAETRKK